MAQVKRFEDHSERWKREARKDGIDAKKWNAWRNLSAKSRKATSPREYAQGKTVRTQIRDTRVRDAVNRVVRAANPDNFVNRAKLTRNIADLPMSEINKVNSFATDADLRRYMKQRNIKAKSDGTSSPYWYK